MAETNNTNAPRRRRRTSAAAPLKKPLSSDQAPGEEVQQVNDKYVGGGPAPSQNPEDHQQHKTGG